MKPIKDCLEFNAALKQAIKEKNKKIILELYDANDVNWDDVHDSIADEYNELVDQANEVLGI